MLKTSASWSIYLSTKFGNSISLSSAWVQRWAKHENEDSDENFIYLSIRSAAAPIWLLKLGFAENEYIVIWFFYLSSFVRIITADSISTLPRTDRMQNSKAKLKFSLSGYYHLTLRWNLRSLGSGTNGCWIEFNIYTKVSAPDFLNIIRSVLMILPGYYHMTVQCYSFCKTVILRKTFILFNYLRYWLFSFYRK